MRARIEEAKRESQNAADAVVAQYKEAAHLAEMRLSDERLAAQARELDESRKQDLARQDSPGLAMEIVMQSRILCRE